jgi:hypothetical protein
MNVNLKKLDIGELRPRITIFGVGGAAGGIRVWRAMCLCLELDRPTQEKPQVAMRTPAVGVRDMGHGPLTHTIKAGSERAKELLAGGRARGGPSPPYA